MSSSSGIQLNTRPDAKVHHGSNGAISHPSSVDHPRQESPHRKPLPDTGWRGEPDIPSKNGGNREEDFMHKPPYEWPSEGGKFKPKYTLKCWCKNIAFEFHGDPLDAKYCHCRQCQSLHGAPFQWAVIFPKTSVRLVRNANDSLYFFSAEAHTGTHYVPCKISCVNCRSPLFDEGRNTVLAFPSSFNFPGHEVPLDFQPTAHIFYGQRVMEVPDAVSKWAGHKGQSKLL